MNGQLKDRFLHTLWLLRNYLPDVVLCGGWVPFIYREYVVKRKPPAPLRTKDIDLVTPPIIPLKKGPGIDQILRKAGFGIAYVNAGFRLSHFGKSSPPVTKYEYEKEKPFIDVEFLTPLKGKEETIVKKIQKGLTAQALRYVDILLDNYRIIKVKEYLSTGQRVQFKVNVSKPAAYIFQKGLSLPERRDKIGKDLYYIYDILDNYSELHDEMYANFKKFRKCYPVKWFKSFNDRLWNYFKDSSSEGPILVEEQYTGKLPKEIFRRRVYRVFQDFLLKVNSGNKT